MENSFNDDISTSADKVATPSCVEDSISTTPMYNMPSYSASPQPMMTDMLTILTALLDKQEESRRREQEEAEKIRRISRKDEDKIRKVRKRVEERC